MSHFDIKKYLEKFTKKCKNSHEISYSSLLLHVVGEYVDEKTKKEIIKRYLEILQEYERTH